MKTVVIVQARMSSSRLPGKVMKTLAGKSVLHWVITRLQQCQQINEVIVATSTNKEDDIVAAYGSSLKATVFRGSLEDVLARFYGAALESQADIIVRVCSDCPWIDWSLIDQMILDFKNQQTQGPIDYLSNTLKRSYSRGLDCEIMTFQALENAHLNARKPFEREHVTPYVYLNEDKFIIKQFLGKSALKDLRWTLDTPEDLEFMERLLELCDVPSKTLMSTEDILDVLKTYPELLNINQHVQQKALQE